MNPIAVVTARAGSKRIPWKNMLPLGDKNLSQISIHHALSRGLTTVVTSDIDKVLSYAKDVGAIPVRRPERLAGGDKHFESIRHAVGVAVSADEGRAGAPVLLLQPTSPFRLGNIIERCLAEHARNPDKIVYSGRAVNYANALGDKVSQKVWDGCVAVYPHEMIGNSPDCIIVENEHANTLQVDTEEDYIQACIQNWRINGSIFPISKQDMDACRELLAPVIGGKTASLVARPDGAPMPQDCPVMWINHCHGWDGGRADVLFVVGSKNITKVGINLEMAEVAKKAKIVIVRDFGEADWVAQNIKTEGSLFIVRSGKSQITTGAYASMIANHCGASVSTIGFQRGVSRIPYCTPQFPNACVSDEIAMLAISSDGRVIDNPH